MYDTVKLQLNADDAPGVDFVEAVKNHTRGERDGEPPPVKVNPATGEIISCIGRLGNLTIIATPRRLLVQGSLTKYALGNNAETMRRQDVERAAKSLENALHVPLSAARVLRLDVSFVLPMQQQITAYIDELGEMPNAARLLQRGEPGTSLYYDFGKRKTTRQIVFYDKAAEMIAKGDTIPEIFVNSYLLRIEYRILQRVGNYLGLGTDLVTLADLYTSKVYDAAKQSLLNIYRAIKPQTHPKMNTRITGKKDLYKAATLLFAEYHGGQVQVLAEIKERQARGELTKKQANDLRVTIAQAYDSGLTDENGTAKLELDKKIATTVRGQR